jgi:hypothetical protein
MEAATARADPQDAARVLRDHVHEVRAKAVGCRERREGAVLQSQQTAAFRPDPHRTIAVFTNEDDGGARRVAASTLIGELTAAHALQTAVVGANPQVVAAVFRERENASRREAVLHGERLDAVVLNSVEARRRPNPHHTAAVLKHRANDVARQSLERAIGDEAASLQAIQAAAERADPDIAFSIFEHREHDVIGQAFFRRQLLDAAVAQATETGVTQADPQAAVL